jgi:hypothetical protein
VQGISTTSDDTRDQMARSAGVAQVTRFGRG